MADEKKQPAAPEREATPGFGVEEQIRQRAYQLYEQHGKAALWSVR